tara:strand:- start:293 stop:844 length:552 start_codon:yes stop_codon:yes gene_type:complete
MKLTLYFFIFFYCLNLKAQESSSGLEKNIFNIEIGAVGFWLNNELKLSDEIALRTEIGLYTEIVKGIGFFMAPEITFEPRWYYNIKKRVFKKLDTRNNSANFLTIRTNFRSSIFEISNYDENRAENSIAFIPKWGIRRNITKSFNYELGAGIGFLSVINQKYSTLSDSDGIVVDAHIRLSYTF